MLKFILNEELRGGVSELMKIYSNSLENFFDLLYLSMDDIKGLLDCGIYIRSHGYRFEWLNKLTYDE